MFVHGTGWRYQTLAQEGSGEAIHLAASRGYVNVVRQGRTALSVLGGPRLVLGRLGRGLFCTYDLRMVYTIFLLRAGGCFWGLMKSFWGGRCKPL